MRHPSTLVLPPACASAIEREARARAPSEACGVLVGRSFGTGALEVVRLHRGRNRLSGDAALGGYELDPGDWFAAWAAAERDRLAVLGVWHSHPGGGAAPSRADAAAAWPGYAYLIAAVDGDRLELRSWLVDPAGWAAQRLAIVTPSRRVVHSP